MRKHNGMRPLDVLPSASARVNKYLPDKFRELLNRPEIDEEIYVHLPPKFAIVRMNRILAQLQTISKGGDS